MNDFFNLTYIQDKNYKEKLGYDKKIIYLIISF